MLSKRLSFFVVFLVLMLVGCASSGPSSRDGMVGNQAMVSVERFLQAANTSDLEAMARIFGTTDGPVIRRLGNPVSCGFRRVGSWVGLSDRCARWPELELWMSSIASILRHDDFSLQSESSVPGRSNPTIRVGVDFRMGNQNIRDVAFVVVQGSGGGWFVEEIDLERITQAED